VTIDEAQALSLGVLGPAFTHAGKGTGTSPHHAVVKLADGTM
jgi:hypothetical protein